MLKKPPVTVPKNRLLNAFEAESRARVDPYLERVGFKLGDIVCEAGGVLDHAYFPDGAVLSLLTVLENGTAMETANIGREGAFGLFAAMYSHTSFNRSLVQLQGGLLRVPIKVLQSEFERSAHIRNLFVSYSETLLAQVQQTVACNSMHTVRERICRWLLMMHDRADGENLSYTHEFLAHVMGTNRKSVTLRRRPCKGRASLFIIGELCRSSLPRSRKGFVRVLCDRQKAVRRFLETASLCVSGRYARQEIVVAAR